MKRYDDTSGIVFRDIVTLALLGIIAIVIILLSHINPKGKNNEEEIKSPGTVSIEITWPTVLADDVDLWVMAPGDRPVGYSAKAGRVFNLLRDDLGHSSDPTPINMEIAFSRGAPVGEYIANIHWYRQKTSEVPVTLTVLIKQDERFSAKPVISRKVVLTKKHQEMTVVRFKLDEFTKVVPGSVHDVPIRIRSGLSP